MGDEGGFDPCECVWGHEMAMRRLLSLLRQSQAYCTDTECFQNVIGPRNQNFDSNFLLMTLFLAFALLMFLLRPRSQRSLSEGPTKPSNNNDFNGAPPSLPPSAS